MPTKWQPSARRGRVFGVKAIAQEIEVRLPSDKRTADDEIAKRAVDVLKWRVRVPADQITVKVEKGIVTLDGEVEWEFQRKVAEHAVHSLHGVMALNNLIRIHARPQVYEIKQKIESALRRSAELDASHISVRADRGRVVLGGKVHAWYERDLARAGGLVSGGGHGGTGPHRGRTLVPVIAARRVRTAYFDDSGRAGRAPHLISFTPIGAAAQSARRKLI